MCWGDICMTSDFKKSLESFEKLTGFISQKTGYDQFKCRSFIVLMLPWMRGGKFPDMLRNCPPEVWHGREGSRDILMLIMDIIEEHADLVHDIMKGGEDEQP